MKSDTPLISVVMPVYNGERFLMEAIQSILHQSVSNLELIAVDDFCTDDSANILASIQDPRLVVVRNPENLGLTRSINIGMRHSRGLYVARMDADDVALPHRFQVQVNALETSDAGMVHSNVLFIDENGNITGESGRDFDPVVSRWKMMFDSYGFHPTFMWKRTVAEKELGGFDEAFPVAQDFDFAWRAMNRIGILGLSDNLLRYRVHGANITSKRRGRQQSLVAAASVNHIAEALQIDALDSQIQFEGVRELTIFRDREEWSPERIEQVLPRYLELWKGFLNNNGHSSADPPPRPVQRLITTDLINAMGVLIAARDFKRLSNAFKQVGKSKLIRPTGLVKAIGQRRWQEKLHRNPATGAPSWGV